MISGILVSILGCILFISFILLFFGGGIYLIINGVQEYLEGTTDSFYLFQIILGCICVMLNVILVLKALGL